MDYSQRYKRIEAAAQHQIEKGAFSGVEWLVLRKGQEWSRGKVGMADAVNGIAMPDKPLYRIYSMTKPIVSIVALMLMEEGKLQLYDPLATYLPEFGDVSIVDSEGMTQPAEGQIVIEHLLTHRAGFSYGFQEDCPVGRMYRKAAIIDASLLFAEMVEKVASIPLAFEPGSRWHYSVATDVLARVIEVVCGKRLPEILDTYIFKPLGMSDTAFMVKEKDHHRIMAAFGESDLDAPMVYDDKPQVLTPADLARQHPTDNPDFYRGGHGLFSTLDDYALFASFLASGVSANNDRMISRKTMEMIARNRIPSNQLPLSIGPILLPGYGYSLVGRVMIDPGEALGLTSHGENGWAGAASTYFWIDQKEDLIGITMAQYLGPKVPLGDLIRNAVYQALD